ncbi:hypothetical protein [Mesobacillus subterraneus]|uniref:hypothetical protein n=1 Tax=Mesobacillus subterraneus TaxID=285983 RepID=UPI001CFE3BAE|nr:hypothetical protein [Mesobacillus subterraneus]
MINICDICNLVPLTRNNQKRCSECNPFFKAANSAYKRCELGDCKEWQIKSKVLKARRQVKRLSTIATKRTGGLTKHQVSELKKYKKRARMGFVSRRDMALQLKYLYYCKQKTRCHYTKVIMGIKGPKGLNFSVERKDVAGRYDIKNTVLCLDIVNRMKNETTNEEEFFDMCTYVFREYIKTKVQKGELNKRDVRKYLVSQILKHI